MRTGVKSSFLPKIKENEGFYPHRLKNGRTDGFTPARTGSWLARNGQLPARSEFCPHEPENDRTEGFIAARNWKLSAQIDLNAVAREFCPHEIISLRSVF
jgi:hypothetical protein